MPEKEYSDGKSSKIIAEIEISPLESKVKLSLKSITEELHSVLLYREKTHSQGFW